MKIVENKFFPGGAFKAINIFGLVFHRSNGRQMLPVDINHEAIHTEQMKELLFIPFYILYGLEWLFKFFYYWNGKKAYRAISFEGEAYDHQYELDYIQHRKRYSWLKYIFHPIEYQSPVHKPRPSSD